MKKDSQALKKSGARSQYANNLRPLPDLV